MGERDILEYYKNVERLEDWKMFWHGNIGFYNGCELQRDVLYPLLKQDLGMFFWERGGKQFYLDSDIDWAGNKTGKFKNFLELKNDAEYEVNHGYDDERNNYYARDFLDCLACLGEDKVKELIKGVN